MLYGFSDKPDIVFITNTQTVNETSSVTLYCNATGNPTPYLQWFNGSKPVSSTSENSVTWVVANISKLNRGDYQCIANNTIGTASLQTSLIVQCKYVYHIFDVSCVIALRE